MISNIVQNIFVLPTSFPVGEWLPDVGNVALRWPTTKGRLAGEDYCQTAGTTAAPTHGLHSPTFIFVKKGNMPKHSYFQNFKWVLVDSFANNFSSQKNK